jgi:hypothetical protein
MTIATFDFMFARLIGLFALIFLGFLLYHLIRGLTDLSSQGEVPAFESYWGGIGRGMGGWSINHMMLLSLLTLLILVMFGGVIYKLLQLDKSAILEPAKAKTTAEDNKDKKQNAPAPDAKGNGQTTDSPSSGTKSGSDQKPEEHSAMNIQIVNCKKSEPVSNAAGRKKSQPANTVCPPAGDKESVKSEKPKKDS